MVDEALSDLVTRLRDVGEPNALIVRRKAADEIERLEAKLDRSRDQARYVEEMLDRARGAHENLVGRLA